MIISYNKNWRRFTTISQEINKQKNKHSRERTHDKKNQFCSLKRLRRRAAKIPVESWEASSSNERLMLFKRSVTELCSSLSSWTSSWSPWILYFCPTDLMLKRRIPVMAKNWMKLCFCFIAFAKKFNFFGLPAPAPVDREEEEAMEHTTQSLPSTSMK